MGTGGLFLRKVRARVSSEPTGFAWIVKGKLAASGYPASAGQVRWFASNGIRSVLTLTMDPIPPQWLEGLDLTVKHIPMGDHMAPLPDALDQGASFIAKSIQDGRPVVVHCLAGEGRTGCVLAAYLIKSEGLGAKDALQKLREVKPEFVEWGQEKSISEYASSLKR